MFVAIHKGKIQIRTDNGAQGEFAMDDHQGVLVFLQTNLGQEEMMIHSSSCDFPEDDGAPVGWSFWKFLREVEQLAVRQQETNPIGPPWKVA